MGLEFKNNEAVQNLFLEQLEKGASVGEASKAVDISRATAYRVLAENPQFKQRAETARTKFLRETASEMRLRTPEAIAALLRVMHSAKSPATAQVSAAKTILEYAMQYGDALEFEETFLRLSGGINDAQMRIQEWEESAIERD